MMKYLRSLFALLLVTLTFTACLKDSSSAPPASAVLFTNASPNFSAFDLYVDGALSLYNIPYGTDTGYAAINPGTFKFDFTATGSTTALLTQSITFGSNIYYSIFVVDTLTKLKMVAVEDDFNTVTADSAQLRYFDFSPDAPFHTVTITNGTDSIQYAIRSFNDQTTATTAFANLKSGTYSVKLSIPGSSTPFKTFDNIALTGGKIYTFYLKGLYNGTGSQSLGLGIIKHFN